MKTTLFILALGTCTFGFSQGLIDGYFKGKGNLDIAVSAFTQTADTYFAGFDELELGGPVGSTIFPQSEVTFNSFGLFAEYGITEKWDVIVNVPVINQIFQDGGIATKYEAVQTKIGGRNFSVIPALQVQFPLSDYETEDLSAVGQRATLISPKVVVQHDLPKGLFIQAQTGYNYGLAPVASSLSASVKVGGSFGKFYVDAWFDFQNGFGEKDFLDIPPSPFREYVVSYQRFGGVVFYSITDMFGVFANASYIFNGRNSYKIPGFGGGLVVKLNLHD